MMTLEIIALAVVSGMVGAWLARIIPEARRRRREDALADQLEAQIEALRLDREALEARARGRHES